MQKHTLIRLSLLHLIAGLFFYLLYHIPGPRPYTNIAYFIALGLIAYWAMKKEGLIKAHWNLAIPWKITGLGLLLMLLIYSATRIGYELALSGKLPISIKPQQWLYFAKPWQAINPLLSVAGILIVVVTLELFYRSYTLEILRPRFSDNGALLISSALSLLRGCSLGVVTGAYDGILAIIWGWVYIKGGLLPAVIVHLVWDILFIYLTP